MGTCGSKRARSTMASLEERKTARLWQLWRWMVETQQSCDTCASEMGTFGVESEMGGKTFQPNDTRCAKRERWRGPSCIQRLREADLWKTRPRQELPEEKADPKASAVPASPKGGQVSHGGSTPPSREPKATPARAVSRSIAAPNGRPKPA